MNIAVLILEGDNKMKTLINKANPQIRITADVETLYDKSRCVKYYYVKDLRLGLLEENWTLVEEEQKPIFEVFGFKVGDAVRLKDGDGRKHIIKSFEEIEGIHGPNFYQVEFEDNSARDGIYPGEEYPNGYYTQMEKFEEEPEKVNCPFDKGDCRYCTVQFCGAREENHIETRSTAEPVDLEKEAVAFCFDNGINITPYQATRIARHFYELRFNARKEE